LSESVNSSDNGSSQVVEPKQAGPEGPKVWRRVWPFLLFVLLATAAVAITFLSLSRFEHEKAKWVAEEGMRQKLLVDQNSSIARGGAELQSIEAKITGLEAQRKRAETLERTISTLEEKVARLTADREGAVERLNAIRSEEAQVTERIKASETRLASLRDDVERKTKEREDIGRATSRNMTEADDSLKQAEIAKKSAQGLKVDLNQLEKSVQEKRKQLADLEPRRGLLAGEVGELEGRKRRLEEDVAGERQRLTDFDADIKKTLERKKAAEADLARAETALKTRETDAERLGSQVVALQKRLDVLSADESVTQGRVDALKIDEVRLKTVSESVEKKTVELRETQASLEQARRDVKSNSDELSRLQSSVVGVRATLETLEQQKQAADDAAKIAATASAATKKELDPLVAQLNKLKSEVADQERKLTGTRDDLVARIGDLQARFSKANESYGILTATLEMLQADIAERRTALEKMKLDEVRRKELEEATARLSAQRDDLQTRIRALEDQIAADAARREKLRVTIEDLVEQQRALTTTVPEQPKTSDTNPTAGAAPSSPKPATDSRVR